MSDTIAEAIYSIRRRIRWAKFLRTTSAFLFLVPLFGYLLLIIFQVRTAHNPDSGFATAGLVLYGLVWSPLLILPLVGWIVFTRRCRILEERLSLLPNNSSESETA